MGLNTNGVVKGGPLYNANKKNIKNVTMLRVGVHTKKNYEAKVRR